MLFRSKLVRINRFTGRVTAIGSLGFQDVQGLAFDTATRTLYGVDGATRRLIRIDPQTGLGFALGPLDAPDIEGLEVDAASGLLYGSDAQTLQLFRINKGTGACTLVGSSAYRVDGLAGRIR